ncbi:MAG: MATE family efflux transporter [Firmicutes bacterium]|nr:MATE family efflux transporter [Bacillota bacterium]
MAEIGAILMQYIDAGMVGSLGAKATASIGLISSTTWLMGGLGIAMGSGYSVQIAHLVGAKKYDQARRTLRQAFCMVGMFGLFMAAIGIGIHSYLPHWLHGSEEICANSSQYFLIYACTIPIAHMRYLASNCLQCSGDMKTPSILNTCLSFLDILFNCFCIFPSFTVLGYTIPGLGLGVLGAALGTSLSEVVVCFGMLYALCVKSEILALRFKESWKLQKEVVVNALKITLPLAFERIVMCGAQITVTRIIAPLGTVSVAANSLGVTAESVCYMPAFGIASAGTTLIGQSLGAKRLELARKLGRMTLLLGVGFTIFTAVIMYMGAPFAFEMLTPDVQVQQLGTTILRIEMLAEAFYGAQIVISGILRGAGDTLIPSIYNLISMWCVRIVLSVLLVGKYGIVGVWVAMAIELTFRGILFGIRFYRERWLKIPAIIKE